MRISLIGTRGVPARYGGFETAVEEVGSRLAAAGHQVLVYCRSGGAAEARPSDRHLGMQLVHLPAVKQRTAETLSHTGLSVLHLMRQRPDVAIVFNAANAPFLPLIRAAGVPVATHVDGLEWRRGKWGPNGRRYYLAAERLAVRWSDALIADARGIQQYYRDRYETDSVFIPYGAPILPDDIDDAGLDGLGLTSGCYHLVVARLEPENHVDLIIEGYLASDARLPLVVVGSVPYPGEHSQRIEDLARRSEQVRTVGAIYDQPMLDRLYAHCASYQHGHSVGGTNPSLLRAMGAGAPVTAFDVVFNREVLGDTGRYFAAPLDVTAAIKAAERDPDDERGRGAAGRARAGYFYDWEEVARSYEQLCKELASSAE